MGLTQVNNIIRAKSRFWIAVVGEGVKDFKLRCFIEEIILKNFVLR